ncbi:MAG: acyl transferase, partial [Sediminibacterium sp.]|nr:acyl transferase [Sediminibacterium sp.]
DIPFLPISFFKSHQILDNNFTPTQYFLSSGTTKMERSKHWIANLNLYEQSIEKCFEIFFGKINNWCIIALLPAYIENKYSSLIYMTNFLMNKSNHPDNGYYLENFDQLNNTLIKLNTLNQPVWLIGVSFALLDFANKFQINGENITVINTGGMKGRGKELIPLEVNSILSKSFINAQISGEYSMTELLSQAYMNSNGNYVCPPWMKIVVSDMDNPINISEYGKGIINIIDLANIHSCSFIKTDDIGEVFADGSFTILGRKDNADLRGCGMLLNNV